MKSKQLANVLIKILGLYVCVWAVPGFVTGITFALTNYSVMKDIGIHFLSTSIGYGIQAIVGICLINLSRKISGFLFRNEEVIEEMNKNRQA